MDELDLLKKDWKKRSADYPQVSYNEIYKMIHKKSSSIVKWIFIISIAELLFWTLIDFLAPESVYKIYEKFNLNSLLYISLTVNYVITILFIYLFYKNYKSICIADDTSLLMKKIIKTRKTVNYYVFYNIALYIIILIVFNIVMFSKPDILIEFMNPNNKPIDNDKLLLITLILQIVFGVLMLGVIWLYYRIIYGILLRRLTKNYKELENMEF
ncbi:hypothetical protein [Lutibacter sp. B1]|uniref:hypothetical protein n=1 Tax=Lutibacter sp. B1 TaxID=2725996 RepID=UPI001456D241|nr:hypothetical protein [Lutibacter sp. B1]NLP58242.1 hypothetical protein [Lutibacter sp. B1]